MIREQEVAGEAVCMHREFEKGRESLQKQMPNSPAECFGSSFLCFTKSNGKIVCIYISDIAYLKMSAKKVKGLKNLLGILAPKKGRGEHFTFFFNSCGAHMIPSSCWI